MGSHGERNQSHKTGFSYVSSRSGNVNSVRSDEHRLRTEHLRSIIRAAFLSLLVFTPAAKGACSNLLSVRTQGMPCSHLRMNRCFITFTPAAHLHTPLPWQLLPLNDIVMQTKATLKTQERKGHICAVYKPVQICRV